MEKGLSAVKLALGRPPAPFFRFPFYKATQELEAYAGSRDIAIFSFDVDSFDFKFKKKEEILTSVMSKLMAKGKGILLLHDFQPTTAEALPALLRELKENGFKIVHARPRQPSTSLARYDDMVSAESKR